MRVLLMVILVVLFSSCVRNKNGSMQQNAASISMRDNGVFEVTEVVQATSYTYMKVKENMSEKWVAVNKQEANVGDIYYYAGALEMTDFKSEDLDRTFDQVYFISRVSDSPIESGMGMTSEMPASHMGKAEVEESTVSMEKGEEELTIGKIYAEKSDFSNQETEIRGIVVKVNNGIMSRNWVHIQDGTSADGNFDLTITTQAEVNVGDEVTFKGTIELDKDYTSGYFYKVILTDAELIDSKQAL